MVLIVRYEVRKYGRERLGVNGTYLKPFVSWFQFNKRVGSAEYISKEQTKLVWEHISRQ